MSPDICCSVSYADNSIKNVSDQIIFVHFCSSRLRCMINDLLRTYTETLCILYYTAHTYRLAIINVIQESETNLLSIYNLTFCQS